MIRVQLFCPPCPAEMNEQRFENISLGLIEAICSKSGGLTAVAGYWYTPDEYGALTRQDVTVFDFGLPGNNGTAGVQHIKNLFSDWLFGTAQQAGQCVVDGETYHWSRELFISVGYSAAWTNMEVLH